MCLIQLKIYLTKHELEKTKGCLANPAKLNKAGLPILIKYLTKFDSRAKNEEITIVNDI